MLFEYVKARCNGKFYMRPGAILIIETRTLKHSFIEEYMPVFHLQPFCGNYYQFNGYYKQ